MTKYAFECPTCNTILTIDTLLDKKDIHSVPPCPCGTSRMNSIENYEVWGCYCGKAKHNDHRISHWD
jgi:transcription elongation factor Elf1